MFFTPLRLPSPPPPGQSLIPLLKQLTWLQWAFFWVGWLAWMCDALDFFSVGLSVSALGTQFNKDTTEIVRAFRILPFPDIHLPSSSLNFQCHYPTHNIARHKLLP
jgi:SHS family lactate transporter-like MFS transporter